MAEKLMAYSYCVIQINSVKIICLLEYASCLLMMSCNSLTHQWVWKRSSQQETISSEIKWLGGGGQPEESGNREICFYVPQIWVKRTLSCVRPRSLSALDVLVYLKSFSQWCWISSSAPAGRKPTTITTAITITRTTKADLQTSGTDPAAKEP